MTFSVRVASRALVLLMVAAGVVGSAAPARAADQKAVVDQIKAHNQAATAAYGSHAFDKMRSEATEALTLAKDNGLGSHAAVAQAYVLLGVAEIEGFKNKDGGVSNFVKALQISPAVEVPSAMAKKAVKAAFAKAEDQDASSTTTAALSNEASKDDSKDKDRDKDKDKDKADKGEKGEKGKEKQAQADKQDKDKAKELATAREAEGKAQAAREKAESEKQDKDKQVGELKSRVAQLEREKSERDKELVFVRDSEKKERDAREKVEKEKAESERQLAEAKSRIQLLEKSRAETEKELASTRDEEKKERDAKDKLEKVWQEADAKEKDRKNKELERAKLAEGPEMPRNIPEPLHCTVPEQAPSGADLYIHCAAQPSVGAKLISFYYRPAGVVPFNALLMEPTKKGWFVAMIPGNRVTGKYLHYYIEARDAKQEVAVTNGKPSSPNVLTIGPAGAAVVAALPSAPAGGGKLKQARSSQVQKKRGKGK